MENLEQERDYLEKRIPALEQEYRRIYKQNPVRAELVKLELEQLKKELKENYEGIYHRSEKFFLVGKIKDAMNSMQLAEEENKYYDRLKEKEIALQNKLTELYHKYYSTSDETKAKRIRLEIDQFNKELQELFDVSNAKHR